jgi:hypothetical protein
MTIKTHQTGSRPAIDQRRSRIQASGSTAGEPPKGGFLPVGTDAPAPKSKLTKERP